MDRSMRPIFFLALFVLVIVSFAPVSMACWWPIGEPPEAFDQASAVFIGKVIRVLPPNQKIEDSSTRFPAVPLYSVEFAVVESWKGPHSKRIVLLANQHNNDCFTFPEIKIGETWLVYADIGKESRKLFIALSNRT